MQHLNLNKALVLEAFYAAFDRGDLTAFERYWSPNYIQHSPHIKPGREGLKEQTKTFHGLHYQHGLIIAEGDLVVVQSRYFQDGLPARIAIDIIRLEDGKLAEHWDVIEEEATASTSLSGYPMFGDSFPE